MEAKGLWDFCGVACPMNLVKAKLALSKAASGESLEFWLDEGNPLENVRQSLAQEGHQILECASNGPGVWRLVVQKK